MDKQINHDKHHDESKTRTHRLSKLPDDGDPWAPNNLLTLEQKKNTSLIPVGKATDKKLRSQESLVEVSIILFYLGRNIILCKHNFMY